MAKVEGKDVVIGHKEIFIKKSSEDWIDIILNTGGVPSTLQDVKSTQHSGGYAYEKQSNRFIYWRTDHDVLELVEESLDVNLTDNQIRYKFTGSHVLEGISVTEEMDSVVILVPTVSSVHRFTYPHPEKIVKKGLSQPSSFSIFHGANEVDAMNPRTYYDVSSTPSAIVTGVSCLSSAGQAVFALALANSSILLVHMDSTSGSAKRVVLTHDSLVPRFLSGITDAFLSSKETSEGLSISMVLHTFNRELYLFCLEKDGQMRVWSCDTGHYLQAAHVIQGVNVKQLKGDPVEGQNHKLCKGCNNMGELIFCAHLQGSPLVVLQPSLEGGLFKFSFLFQASPPPDLELVDMVIGEGGNIWCGWLTAQEQPIVTRLKLPTSDWSIVALSKPALQVKPSSFVTLDPAQMYLDAILTCGYFTATDVAKAISTYRTSAVIDPAVDIREQIRAIVEAEVYNEVSEILIDDDEFLEVSQRSWSRLYSCCTQFLVSGMTPLGLLWLPSCDTVVLIKATGFSLVRDMTVLEAVSLDPNDQTREFGELVHRLKDVDIDAGIERLELALHLGENLSGHLSEAAALVAPSDNLNAAMKVLSDDNIKESLNALVEELYIPEDFTRPGPDGEGFCSESGVGAVITTFRDLCTLRLRLCEKVLLLLQVISGTEVPQDYSQVFSLLCKAYYILCWTCTSNVSVDVPLVEAFASAHPFLMQPTIMDSVFSLANNLWPRNNNEHIPQHLLNTKQYCLLNSLCRIIGPNTWNLYMAQAFLATGEASKAYDLVMSNEADVAYYLKVTALFEHHRHPDLVISVARRAIGVANPTVSELETLHSLLFIHELQLGHFEAAYTWVEAIPDAGGKSDCLHRLLVEMLSANKLQELLALPYTGLLDQLERLLETRARTLPIDSALTYYNLLYAIHIKYDNFKKASSVMFEQGMRAESVEMQWKCYGACLNAMMLVDTSEAWIVKPTGTTEPDKDSIEVLEVHDIRKEFELAAARYNLGNCPIDTTPSEVIGLCNSNGHFKTGMRLASMCKLSLEGSVEGLATACVGLSEPKAPWKWLTNNEIYDLIVTETNCKTVCWRILEKLINKYEKPNQTELHRAVANKLMELSIFLPTWLLSSYKKRNAAELLRLYMRHGDLAQASDLAVDYLNAGLGIAKERFNIDKGLLSTGPPIWLPINTIDRLLKELKEYKISDEVESTLKKYIETANRVSADMAFTTSA